jgi:hypothetical protein
MDKDRVHPSKPKLNRNVIDIGAPDLREFVVCRESRRIVSHGMCDRCRKRQERQDDRLIYTPASAVSPAKGTKNLATLYRLMDECKVSGTDKRVILERFLPCSALPQNVQEAHLEALSMIDPQEDREPSMTNIHAGSSAAPSDSTGREPEMPDDLDADPDSDPGDSGH